MLVSVIVPVRNESSHIRQTLECLRQQEFPEDQFEVLVVDGLSDDGTVRVIRDVQSTFPQLQLLPNPQRLSSAARNVGVVNSKGKYVVIVDGHCKFDDRRYLAKLVDAFETTRADSLGRPQPLRVDEANSFQEAVAAARESWLGHNPDSSIYSDRARFVAPDNVAVAYRRDVFDKVGLFDEQFDACEDVEFNTRLRQAGMTCYFTPAIRVNYQPRPTLRGFLYQMFRYGSGRSRLGRKHPRSITWPSLVPVLWLLWLPLTFALGFTSSLFAAAFCLSLLIYAFSVLAESLRLSLRHPSKNMAQTPLVFFAIHIGFGWGFIRDRLSSFTSSR